MTCSKDLENLANEIALRIPVMVDRFFVRNDVNGLDKDLFISEGNFGLLRSLESYDGSSDARTYFLNGIKLRLNYYLRTSFREMSKFGRNNLSLDAGHYNNQNMYRFLEYDRGQGPEEVFESEDERNLLGLSFKKLSFFEREVVKMFYFEGYNGLEIGRILGIRNREKHHSGEYIRQVLGRSLEKLKREFRRRGVIVIE